MIWVTLWRWGGKLYSNPLHPHQALLSAVPVPDQRQRRTASCWRKHPVGIKSAKRLQFHNRCPGAWTFVSKRRRSATRYPTTIMYTAISMMTKSKENKGMKLFISADIEGCAGMALAYETHKNEAAYGMLPKVDDKGKW